MKQLALVLIMTLTFSLTDLQTDVSLLYEGGDDIATLAESVRLEAAGDAEVWHEPDRGERQLVALEDGDRMFSLNADIVTGTSSWDDVLDKLTIIKRWIHGARQQAARAEMSEPVRPIYLKVQLDGSTNATLHRIKRGAVPDLNGMFSQKALLNKVADGLPVHLQLAPYGEAERPIVGNNVLHSTPHFLHFSSVVGAAHGWSAINGAEAITITSDVALIGRYSQRVSTTTAGHGLRSDLATVPANHLGLGYCWVIVESGTLNIHLRNSSGTSVGSVTGLTSAMTTATSGVEQALVDRNGNAWYLVNVPQTTFTTDDQIRLSFEQSGATATVWHADGCQVQTVEAANLIPRPSMDKRGDIYGGYAMGWYAPVLDRPTASLVDTDYFLSDARTKSQSIEFNPVANEQVFRTIVFEEAAQGVAYEASAWIKLSSISTTDNVTFRLKDGADNVLDSVSFHVSNIATQADASATGADAATWYQFRLSGTNSDAAGIVLDFTCDNNPAAILYTYVDEVYLWRSADHSFNKFVIFTPVVYGRNDYDASNPERVNTVDLFNVPGDAPAAIALTLALEGASGSNKRFWVSKYSDGLYPVVKHSFEAELMDVGSGGAKWTTPGTEGSGGDFHRFTGAAASDTGYITHTLPAFIYDSVPYYSTALLLSFASTPRVAYARARTSKSGTTGSTVQLKYNTSSGATVTRTARTFGADNTWEWIELGPLDFAPLDAADNTSFGDTSFEIHVVCDNGETVDIDKVEYLPAGEDNFLLAEVAGLDSTSDRVVFNGYKELVHRIADGTPQTRRGTAWTVQPGNHMTRLVIGWAETDNAHDISEYMIPTVKVWPRTTGLLGTI